MGAAAPAGNGEPRADRRGARADPDGLAGWSRFWLETRRRAGHALPYYQHGNDSGWDNSTTFDVDRVIESPDLAAFLALQLDVLADLSDELDRPSVHWRDSGALMVRDLVDQLWTGTEFIAVGALSGRPSTATSLLNLLPLVLGDRLPLDVRSSLADQLSDHLTAHGPATERPPPPTTRTTATGADRSGHRPPPSSRTVCDAAGSPTSPTWSVPGSGCCVNARASPRTSTPAPVPAFGTGRTRGLPRSTSSSPLTTCSAPT